MGDLSGSFSFVSNDDIYQTMTEEEFTGALENVKAFYERWTKIVEAICEFSANSNALPMSKLYEQMARAPVRTPSKKIIVETLEQLLIVEKNVHKSFDISIPAAKRWLRHHVATLEETIFEMQLAGYRFENERREVKKDADGFAVEGEEQNQEEIRTLEQLAANQAVIYRCKNLILEMNRKAVDETNLLVGLLLIGFKQMKYNFSQAKNLLKKWEVP